MCAAGQGSDYRMNIKRLVMVAVAYFGACLLAGTMLAAATMAAMLLPQHAGLDINWQLVGLIVFFVAYHSVLVAVAALIPAAIAITVTERAEVVAPPWYALAGGIVGIAAMGIIVGISLLKTDEVMGIGFYLALGYYLAVVVVAGACAGLMFWLVAVRSPASRLHRSRARPQTQ
jgi:hypothetical protein